MQHSKLFIIFTFLLLCHFLVAQTTTKADTTNTPIVEYTSNTKKYEIAQITVSGTENYEDFVLVGFSGLAVGDVINVPGEAITNAIKRFWKQGLFSEVKIVATKIKDDKIWLNIALKERPQVSEVKFTGLKKSEIEDLETKIGIAKGTQITPNGTDKAKKIIAKFMGEKGFLNTEVEIVQSADPNKSGHVIVTINVDKKQKTKIHELIYTGNVALNHNQVNHEMKKTNDNNWRNIFRTKKFVKDEYEKDKIALIEKYNEIGYRDAYIVSDSVTKYDDKSVNVHININEGKKYFFRNIKWVGNTIYPYDYLNTVLRIKKGDVYNHKTLTARLQSDDDAVGKLYQDRGYLFFQLDPVEVEISGDSIDFEMRMYEGKPATINEITINGNSRVYEHVVRRELRTKPGQLYSQSDIMRSLRELAQMGHFNPEKITPDIKPNPENGTVDIAYQLETKGSDQVEFSAGYGGYTGIVGSVGLKFSNFAIQNIFRPDTYRIVPQGEGQTLTLNGRTNGPQYSSVSLSFLDPWFGGKRPNSFSTSIYYSKQSYMSDRYANSAQAYNQLAYSNMGYGNNQYNQTSSAEYDPTKYMTTIGASIGYGKRLSWPDDYFTFQGELSYQLFQLSKWIYGTFPMSDGAFNNISLGFTLNRSSIDNPLYTRSGSTFSIGLKITPPYSSFNNKNYADPNLTMQERYKYIEYHKWTFSGKTFTPISADNKLVIMTKAQFAYLGYYDINARSPFEKYDMGGSGMATYVGYGTEIVSMRGYADGSLTPSGYMTIMKPDGTPTQNLISQSPSRQGNLYNKFTMELRYPLSLEQSATIYLLTFAEAGNCFSSITNYNPYNLKRSLGVGARIFLPMLGMMGIDWGYGFDKINGQVSGSQFHFILGQEL